MIETIERATLFALYQLSIALGILLLPLALVAQRGGVTLPVGRLVDHVGSAYENARA